MSAGDARWVDVHPPVKLRDHGDGDYIEHWHIVVPELRAPHDDATMRGYPVQMCVMESKN